MPSVAELMRALPESDEAQIRTEEIPPAWPAEMSMRPVPVGRLRRVGLLGTLQAKIGAAYLFYWIRGWFRNAAEKERSLAELHWKTAVRLLDTMSYLRGAVMKVGQTLANFPDIAPQAFIDTLDRLHFDAPPMHWSLLREMVYNELGNDPENIFASFDKKASAAASLGQVHRASLRTGEEVMVKIQYPGIARTVREDIRNLLIFMLPARFSRDWENTKEQFADLRMRLERETDYEQEAVTQQKARSLFREDDDIVVPRVIGQFTRPRVLTMERVRGVHLDEFLATHPSQEVRNDFARKIIRALYRMMYAGRLLYADIHPGNFLFMDDGRLGLIDFGFTLDLNDAQWELFRKLDRPQTTGRRDERVAVLKEWHSIGDDPADSERLRMTEEFADWGWRPRYAGTGEFDFGDEADFRREVDLMLELMRKRYSRGQSCTPVLLRMHTGIRSILYRLRAKIDFASIAEEEVRAAGWDRSEYAPN